MARQHGATVITTPGPAGPAKARNVGARAAIGDLLLFVDADVVVEPNTVDVVQSLFAADPKLDAVIGSYDDAPGQTNFVSQYRNLMHHYVHQHASAEATTFWGACGAIRRGPSPPSADSTKATPGHASRTSSWAIACAAPGIASSCASSCGLNI